MTFMGFGSGTLVFMLTLSWCDVVLSSRDPGLGCNYQSFMEIGFTPGPRWVEANNPVSGPLFGSWVGSSIG